MLSEGFEDIVNCNNKTKFNTAVILITWKSDIEIHFEQNIHYILTNHKFMKFWRNSFYV